MNGTTQQPERARRASRVTLNRGEKGQARRHGRAEREIAHARALWGSRLLAAWESQLREIVAQLGLSVRAGDFLLLTEGLYVSHAGLLRLARRQRCAGIETEVVAALSDPVAARWVVKATVFKSARARHHYVGYGDADPTNVAAKVRGAELRVAETRAVNRALRKAYAVGLCSAEEIGASKEETVTGDQALAHEVGCASAEAGEPALAASPSDGEPTGRSRSVADRLKLLIRDFELDPAGLQAYGCDYLEVANLTEAPAAELSRLATHVENFAGGSRDWLRAEIARAAARRRQPGKVNSEVAAGAVPGTCGPEDAKRNQRAA